MRNIDDQTTSFIMSRLVKLYLAQVFISQLFHFQYQKRTS